jgi:FtsZ-interacting cell division protein ZipA
MVSHLLDRIVCAGKSDIDKIMEIAPFIIFGAIWIIGLIVKSLYSKSGKKDEQPQQPGRRAMPPQPDLENFVKMVKRRYVEAKEEAMHAEEKRIYRPQQPLPPKPSSAMQIPRPFQPPLQQQPSTTVKMPSSAQLSLQQEMPQSYVARTGLKVPEPELPQVKDLPIAQEPGLPDLSQQIEKVDEVPVEMTALDRHIYEPSHKPYLPELAEQIATTDGLRKAILYSEIFGRPVGMRED